MHTLLTHPIITLVCEISGIQTYREKMLKMYCRSENVLDAKIEKIENYMTHRITFEES